MAPTATTTENRYLSDNFGPVHEEITATDLRVTGALPSHLDGRYLRIGPNPARPADPQTYHWFLGDGMVHGVRLRDGQAQWYRNRWVRSRDVQQALGETPRSDAGDNDFASNTNVLRHGGRTLALVEAGAPPYELTDDLDTVGPCDFGATLRGGYTAHPHEDPDTGELHAISYNFTRGNRVEYTVVGTDGRVRRAVDVEVGGSPMIHDCAITENYVIIYDLPVTFDIGRAAAAMPPLMRLPTRLALSRVIGKNPLPDPVIARMTGGRSRSRYPVFPYTWDPSYPARIGLLPREGRAEDIRWFDVDPCYVFHTLNAYESPEDTTVVIDVVRHERMFARDLSGPNEGPPTLARFTLDLTSGKTRESTFDEQSQEFPRVDERLTGRRHRYGYAVGFAAGRPGDGVIKHDLVAGTSYRRELGAGREASEFCFVANPGSTVEDDGVLMGYVYDRESGRSNLTVLDAATLDDVATVELPARVPAGFHGNWSPSHA